MTTHSIRNPQQTFAQFVAEFAACILVFFSHAPHAAQRKNNQSIGQSVATKRNSIESTTRGAVA
jgi:hypothetical protein